jgi:hypothetical protein
MAISLLFVRSMPSRNARVRCVFSTVGLKVHGLMRKLQGTDSGEGPRVGDGKVKVDDVTFVMR